MQRVSVKIEPVINPALNESSQQRDLGSYTAPFTWFSEEENKVDVECLVEYVHIPESLYGQNRNGSLYKREAVLVTIREQNNNSTQDVASHAPLETNSILCHLNLELSSTLSDSASSTSYWHNVHTQCA